MNQANEFENGDSKPYWDAAREGRLVFQRCCACGEVQFPPRHHCVSCWESDIEWIQSSGLGKVESFTIVRRAPTSVFRDKVPYAVVAVKVEEGPTMITNLIGEDALDVRIGDAVQVDFVEDAGGNVLPQYKRAAAV